MDENLRFSNFPLVSPAWQATGNYKLNRLDLDHENWVKNVQKYGSLFHYYAGKIHRDAKSHCFMAENRCPTSFFKVDLL